MSVDRSSFSKATESHWCNLPGNILTLIANRLNKELDQGSCGTLSIHNLCLRSVCKSWRSSIPARNKKTIPTILPFPILPHPKLNPNQCRFILSQSTIYLLRQHQQHRTPVTNSVGHYWLLRLEEETFSNISSGSGEKWRPLNPLSRILTSDADVHERLQLPKGFPKKISALDFNIFETGRAYSLDIIGQNSKKDNYFDEVGFVRIDKVVVSSSPFIIDNNVDTAFEADYLVVMAICNLKLGIFKFGDEKWIPIDDPKDHGFLDVVFHKGKFYAVDYQGKAFSIGPDLKAKEIAPGVGYLREGGEYKNLVTSGGDLFMIDTFFDSEQFVGYYDPCVDEYIMQQPDPVRLKIYKLNEEKREWERVFDLNDHVFFVGYDCSYSVSALDFAGLKPNCVYYYVDDSFRDPNEENKLGEFFTGIGVYDISVGSCRPLSKFPDHWPIFMPLSTLRCNTVVESQWSHLPSDILTMLTNRLNNNLGQGSSDSCGALSIHNLRLRSVCKSWRSSIPIQNKKSAPSILPFPILPNPKLSPNQGHLILSQSTVYLLKQNQKYQISTTNSIGQYWLLRVKKETSIDSSSSSGGGEKWRPLNPLSRTLTSDVDEHKRLLLPKGFPKSINVLDFCISEIDRAYSLDIVHQTSKEGNSDDWICSHRQSSRVFKSFHY